MASEEPQFTVKLSKIKNNRVLDRVQMVVDVFYAPNVKVTKENIKKKNRISIQKITCCYLWCKKSIWWWKNKMLCYGL